MDFTYIIVVVLVLVLVVVIAASKEQEKKRQEAEQAKRYIAMRKEEQAVVAIALKVQAELSEIDSPKGLTARVGHCKKAIGLLHSAKEYWPIYKEVIENYDELEVRLESMQKVLPVIDYVEKAYKARFKGNASSELNALIDALYAVQTGQVTNGDLIRAEIFPEGAFGEIVQIEDVIERAKELGWEGPKDGSAISGK